MDNAFLGAASIILQGDTQEARRYIQQARKHLIQAQTFTMDQRLDMFRQTFPLSDRVTAEISSLGGVNRMIITAIPIITVSITETSGKWSEWDAGTPISSLVFSNSFGLHMDDEAKLWITGNVFENTPNSDLVWVEIVDEILDSPTVNYYGINGSFDNWSPFTVAQNYRPFGANTKPPAGIMAFNNDVPSTSDSQSATQYRQSTGVTEWTDGQSPGSGITGWHLQNFPVSAWDSSGNMFSVVALWQEDNNPSPAETEYNIEVIKNGATATELESWLYTNGDASGELYETAKITISNDDRIFLFYGENFTTYKMFYRVSINAGVSWSGRTEIVESTFSTNDFRDTIRAVQAVGNTIFISNRNSDRVPRFIYTTNENDWSTWSDPINPFDGIGEMWLSFRELEISGSSDGRYVAFHARLRDPATTNAIGQHVAVYQIGNADPENVTLTLLEQFQLTGNPDYTDPPGVTAMSGTDTIKIMPDGTARAWIINNDTVYRRSRTPY